MASFPKNLRPSISFSSSLTGANVSFIRMAGGSSRATLITSGSKLDINVRFTLPNAGYMKVWNDWYFNVIDQGGEEFEMLLDLDGTFKTYTCKLKPGTMSVRGNKPFTVSMTIETTGFIGSPVNGHA